MIGYVDSIEMSSRSENTQKLKRVNDDFSGFDFSDDDVTDNNSVDLDLFVTGVVKPNDTGVIGTPNLEKQSDEKLNNENDLSGFEFADDVGEDDFNFRTANRTKTSSNKFSYNSRIKKPNIIKRGIAKKNGYAYLQDKQQEKVKKSK